MSAPDALAGLTAVYGAPPPELGPVERSAVQVSPLVPGAAALERFGKGELQGMTLLAPAGTVERRYVLALSLQVLAPGAPMTAMAPKDKGGARLRKELEAFGCEVSEMSKRHHRICTCAAPSTARGLEDAVEEGRPRFIETLGLWSQPGVFSWNRVDPGSALLAQRIPAMAGRGADLGCGIGFLAQVILKSAGVERIMLIDNDRRAVEATRRNIDDPRARLYWGDAVEPPPEAVEDGLAALDFVVMNPPFHDGGTEDRALGLAFIRSAAQKLRPGGVCWLVANRHLPYEAALESAFSKVRIDVEQGGYKVFEARR